MLLTLPYTHTRTRTHARTHRHRHTHKQKTEAGHGQCLVVVGGLIGAGLLCNSILPLGVFSLCRVGLVAGIHDGPPVLALEVGAHRTVPPCSRYMISRGGEHSAYPCLHRRTVGLCVYFLGSLGRMRLKKYHCSIKTRAFDVCHGIFVPGHMAGHKNRQEKTLWSFQFNFPPFFFSPFLLGGGGGETQNATPVWFVYSLGS